MTFFVLRFEYYHLRYCNDDYTQWAFFCYTGKKPTFYIENERYATFFFKVLDNLFNKSLYYWAFPKHMIECFLTRLTEETYETFGFFLFDAKKVFVGMILNTIR